MRDIFVHEIVSPLARRVGTAAAGTLIGYGVANEAATAISVGLVALIGVLADFSVAYAQRKWAER